MSFFTLPPEINSLRMFIGAGTAPMLEAAAAWQGLAEELGTAAQSFASVTAGLAGQAWQGSAAMAMANAAAPYAGWLAAAAAQSLGAAGNARAVASMFEAAQAATVLPASISANRNAFVQLVMSNLFGQNAPAIAAAESIYEEMWAADVAAMSGYYSGVSAVAAQVVPWQNVLKSLPGLGGGALGAGGGGATGGAYVGGQNGAGSSAGSGTATAGAGGDASAGTGGVGGGGGAVGTGGYAGAASGGNTGAAYPQGDATSAAAYSGNSGIGAGGHVAASPGVGGPAMGFVPVPMMAGAGGSSASSAGAEHAAPPSAKSTAETGAASETAPEVPVPRAAEAEKPAPQMKVLPTAAPEIAATAAPDAKPQAARAGGAGIPASKLRPSRTSAATAEDRQVADAEAAEEMAVPLRPDAVAGELRPRATQEPKVQVRGG
ncbi:putative PPE family protein PPE42 [Mycobacterium basiliense]|uniref:Putative PPE family protein PPE42 n=1 Tax=Mycobacterium basiliense TaxID=2094119 RepID=A0A3S4BDU3_9MYCO|nr:PPE family protein [Mycobacterium basiliense]VDM87768.1 putative PPE family protein PPE42 [Mycobacterium basiliense]